MKKEYDFSKAKRGAVVPTTGKTRITLYLDNEVLEHFRIVSEQTGRGYQTLINEMLKTQVGRTQQPLTPELVRRIVREELALQS
ncbi:MAG: BrnA antitoxin family protein [Deltaproteobacteria bacterium]|nr:BrnA antitoxin family protein [Deltaproteobacteria bacterium]